MARQLCEWDGRYVTFCRDKWGHIRPHAPGRDYCRECWPPRGRGRGEALTSVRRAKAISRAIQAERLYGGLPTRARWIYPDRPTLTQVAKALGYKDKSGAWRAIHRVHAMRLQYERMHERILTPEDEALRLACIDYEADEAERQADALAARKAKKQQAANRKRQKTLQAKRLAALGARK